MVKILGTFATPRMPHAKPMETILCVVTSLRCAKVGDDQTIKDVAFEGRGCAISLASASVTEIASGKSISQVQSLFDLFHKLCTGEEEGMVPDEFADDIEKLR